MRRPEAISGPTVNNYHMHSNANGKVRYKTGLSLAQYTPVLELPSPSLDISDHGGYGLPNGTQTSLVHRDDEVLALMANAAHRGNDDGRSYTERLENLALRCEGSDFGHGEDAFVRVQLL